MTLVELPDDVLDKIVGLAVVADSVEMTQNLLLVCKRFQVSVVRLCDIKDTFASQTDRNELQLGVCTAARLRRLLARDIRTLSFSELTRLTKLTLETRMQPDALPPTLKHLEMGYSGEREFTGAVLAPLTALTYLKMNRWTPASHSVFRRGVFTLPPLPSLECLICAMPDAGIIASKYPRLQTLELLGLDSTPDTFRRLEALPPVPLAVDFCEFPYIIIQYRREYLIALTGLTRLVLREQSSYEQEDWLNADRVALAEIVAALRDRLAVFTLRIARRDSDLGVAEPVDYDALDERCALLPFV